MSHMSRLAVEIDEAGIDYREVDLEDVEAFREAYQDKTGHTITGIQAIKEMYGTGLQTLPHTNERGIEK